LLNPLFLVVHSLPTGVSAHDGPIYTNAVLGYANITSLQAYNSSFNVPYGASLQLNVVLEATSTNGNTYYFWLQNVAQFVTNESLMCFTDNVWNYTTATAEISNVTGNGGIGFTYNILFGHPTFYGYSTEPMPYRFPLALYLLINESLSSNGVIVNFIYVVLQNGSLVPPHPVTYDSVFIPVPDPQSAYIIVNDSLTPSAVVLNFTLFYQEALGNLMDTELVWGGYENGEFTTFTQMSSYLGLFYLSGNSFVPFSTVYTYGNDTAESTGDLYVSIASNGDAYVTVGTPDYGLLTDSFHPYIPGFTFVNVTSKVPFLVNGTYTNSFVGYVVHPVTITFYRNYTVNSSSYAVLDYPSQSLTITPSNTFKNVIITPQYTYYYKVIVNSSRPLLLNISGKETLTNGTLWLPQGTSVSLVNNTYYVSSGERFVVNNTYPNLPLTVENPTTITVTLEKQFKLTINSPIPLLLSINGKSRLFNGTTWVLQGSAVELVNNTYYVSSGERYVVSSISPSTPIEVSGPMNISVELVKEYKVEIVSSQPVMATIKGETEPVNGTAWLPQGSVIHLTANLPVYLKGYFVGTYNASPGEQVTINGPIYEKLVVQLNYTFLEELVIPIVTAVVIVVAITRRR